MVQGGLKKVQGGLEPPLAPYFPRLWLLHALTVTLIVHRGKARYSRFEHLIDVSLSRNRCRIKATYSRFED